MERKLRFFTIVICAGLTLFMANQCSNEYSKRKSYEDLSEARNDTLRSYRNKAGEHVSETRLLQSEVKNFLKIVSSRDSTIAALQEMVDLNTISATILETSTTISTTTNTVTVEYDTVFVSSPSVDSIQVLPIYTGSFQNPWYSSKIRAARDSIQLDLKIRNRYEIEQTWKKQDVVGAWLRPKVAVVTVTNKNPYTETRELRSFSVTHKKGKGKGFKATLIFAAGALVGIVVTNKLK